MKTKILLISIFSLAVAAGLGLLMSCDEEKAVNTSPTACLQITSFQQSGNLKSVNAGGSYTFTREIKNDGPSDAKDVTLGYYLSTDDKIATSDTPLNVEDKLDLPSGTNNIKNVDIKIPASVAPGTKYYIGVLVTSSSCLNNCPEYKSCELIINDQSVVDTNGLRIFEWGLAANQSEDIKAGDLVSFYGTLINDCSHPCSNILVKYYLSTDTNITSDDIYLNAEKPFSIPAKDYIELAVKLSMPENLEPGIYYIGMLIISSECQITSQPSAYCEVRCSSSPLKILDWDQEDSLRFQYKQAFIYRGLTHKFRRIITNEGISECSNIQVKYYISRDAHIRENDLCIGEETLNLAAKETSDVIINLKIPLDVKAPYVDGYDCYIGLIITASSCQDEPGPTANLGCFITNYCLTNRFNDGDGAINTKEVICGNAYPFYRRLDNGDMWNGTYDCGDVIVRYYLTTDCDCCGSCKFSKNDILLSEEVIPMPAYSYVEGTINLTIPSGLTPGKYKIYSCIEPTDCISNCNYNCTQGWEVSLTCP